MKSDREILEEQLENYEERLKSASSYVRELKSVTAKLGTPSEQFEDDLIEAEHNIGFYEGEIAEIKKELGGSATPAPTQPGVGTILSQIPKPGISALFFSAIGLIAGVILGSRLNSRRGG
jgi:hypothetical protein